MRTFSDEIDWNLSESTTIGPAPVAPDEEPTQETTVDPRIAADVAQGSDPALPLSTWTTQVMAGQGAQDLISQEMATLATFGIESKGDELFFKAGTALADTGHEALKRYAKAYAKLPDPDTAVARFTADIASEERQDRMLDLAGYRLNHAGRLSERHAPDDARGLDLSRTAYRQLTEIAGQPNINAGMTRRKEAPRRVRTRANKGEGREAFGLVSERYAVLDGPQAADMVARALKAQGLADGCKMEITYDRDTTRYQVRAIVQAPIDVPALWGVGRVHQAFFQLTGGDDGMSAHKGNLGAHRVRCLNATIAQIDGLQWSQAHKGTVDIMAMVANSVAQFGALGESLREVWSRAAANHYLDTDGSQLSVTEAITRLVAHGHVPKGGLELDQAVDRYVQAWKAEESPTSAAGILMAVQRAAHEGTWATKWSTTEIEASASNLLYQPVWQLAEVEA